MELDQVAKLKRYFFLGKLIPVYTIRKADSLIEDLELVKELLLNVDADTFLTLIKSVTQREKIQLPRRNEVWFTYAVYLSTCEKVEDRKKVYQAFPEVAPGAEDMFTVVHYASMIQKNKKRKGHSRTMRKALKLWYETRTEAELIGMLEKGRGMYGFTHKDLIASSHINMEKVGLGSLYRAIFKSSSKALEEMQEENAPKFENAENQAKLKQILELKTCKDAAKAVRLIKNSNVAIECVPSNFLRKSRVWTALIPGLKHQELLRYLFHIIDARLLKHSFLIAQVLKSIEYYMPSAVDGTFPVTTLIYAKKIQTLKRYSEKKKALYYAEKVKRKKIKDNSLLGFKVNNLFKHVSFKLVLPKTGLRFCIVLNLQTNYETKPVINQKQVFCMEAALTLALNYFHSESYVDIFTYTPMEMGIEKLNFPKDISFDTAQMICKSKQTPKNVQCLFSPILDAFQKSSDYDVFLIIVPTGALRNPHHKPDVLIHYLDAYRASKKKERVRCIIVNLRRYKPSMKHSNVDIRDTNILEICGFGEDTVDMINAFATYSFS